MFMPPGLALFYGGMVRAKSVLNTMALTVACLGVVSVIWVGCSPSCTCWPMKPIRPPCNTAPSCMPGLDNHLVAVMTDHLAGGNPDAMSAKVAIVAGAGGALGHATAVTLAAGGLTVVAVDRNERGLGDLPDEVRREVADATDAAAATRLIDRIAVEVGPPDVLVNTIGAFRPGDVLATTPETLRLMIDVNL